MDRSRPLLRRDRVGVAISDITYSHSDVIANGERTPVASAGTGRVSARPSLACCRSASSDTPGVAAAVRTRRFRTRRLVVGTAQPRRSGRTGSNTETARRIPALSHALRDSEPNRSGGPALVSVGRIPQSRRCRAERDRKDHVGNNGRSIRRRCSSDSTWATSTAGTGSTWT